MFATVNSLGKFLKYLLQHKGINKRTQTYLTSSFDDFINVILPVKRRFAIGCVVMINEVGSSSRSHVVVVAA